MFLKSNEAVWNIVFIHEFNVMCEHMDQFIVLLNNWLSEQLAFLPFGTKIK